MDLKIPKIKDGKFKSSLFLERKRAVFMLDEVVRALSLTNVSSRKVGRVIEILVGSSLSHSYIISVLERSEDVISEFRNIKITDDYPVLYIDATYISLKRDNVEKEDVYAVLCSKKMEVTIF